MIRTGKFVFPDFFLLFLSYFRGGIGTIIDTRA